MGSKDFDLVAQQYIEISRYSVTPDSLIYTAVYVPFMDMKKCKLRIFLFSRKIFLPKSNDNSPPYEIYRNNKSTIETI